MTFPALDIPDDQEELVPWLERQIVGMELGDLVATLAVIHEAGDSATLDDIFGAQLNMVLSEGLGALPEHSIQQLLTHPQLLLDLQEWILVEGAEYWQTVAVSRATESIVERQYSRVHAQLGAAATESTSADRWESRPRERRQTWIVGLVAAAAVVVVAVLVNRQEKPAANWGWDAPDALSVDLPADEYLRHLASAADTWFNKRPEDAESLGLRLAEFRHGCDTLIAAPHPQLVADDRQWLVDRCRAWAEKIDGHIAALKSGEDVLRVRDEADETVRSLVEAIENRARTLG